MGGRSPGQWIVLAIIVLVALLMFGGDASPRGIAEAAADFARLLALFIISLTIHEFAHAASAWYLGDSTARYQGRFTLDPRAHLDPVGTFMMALTLILGFGLGWAKPVPVNPYRLLFGPKTGMAIVAFAGPASNIVLAFASIHLAPLLGLGASSEVSVLLIQLAQINIVLALFNLIPIPPLDGSRILIGILPEPLASSLARLEPYGPMLLMFLVLFLPGVFRTIVGGAVGPLLRFLSTVGGLI